MMAAGGAHGRDEGFGKKLAFEVVRSRGFWLWLTAITIPLASAIAAAISR
jgi:hypothetical protein